MSAKSAFRCTFSICPHNLRQIDLHRYAATHGTFITGPVEWYFDTGASPRPPTGQPARWSRDRRHLPPCQRRQAGCTVSPAAVCQADLARRRRCGPSTSPWRGYHAVCPAGLERIKATPSLAGSSHTSLPQGSQILSVDSGLGGGLSTVPNENYWRHGRNGHAPLHTQAGRNHRLRCLLMRSTDC